MKNTTKDNEPINNLDKIVSLCKRRGFIFQNSEIYGGLGSIWDYGPLGTQLKRNIKESWWNKMVLERKDIVGLDSSILMNPDIWKASGHLDNFTDPLVECQKCNQRWREDQLNKNCCPACSGELSEARLFNLMFKTSIGPVEKDSTPIYLRPETAQGIFVNFNNVTSTTRKKLPFGIAQIGKAFRNEITTGNFIFRTREFEMMEMEYFVFPGEDEKWHKYWINESLEWYKSIGINSNKLRVREHGSTEMAHYSKATADIEYNFSWGWGEITGIANRTDFDLKAHSNASGENLSIFDDKTNQHITPYVIEPSIGIDRTVVTLLLDAYNEEESINAKGNSEKRVFLKFDPEIAPIKIAVLPLSRNEAILPLSNEIYELLLKSKSINGSIDFDDSQSIGRRYRRQDEIGTPICITIDFDSLNDNSVTIRDRNTMLQNRVKIENLELSIIKKLNNIK